LIVLKRSRCGPYVIRDWDQNECMPTLVFTIATGWYSLADNLATVIDAHRIYRLQAGVGDNPGAQIDDGVLLPQYFSNNAGCCIDAN
jgi:hypothetical protein